MSDVMDHQSASELWNIYEWEIGRSGFQSKTSNRDYFEIAQRSVATDQELL